MTQIVCAELNTTDLEQTFTLTSSRRYMINAVRPLIIMYNAPAGTFTISFKSGATTLASKTFTSASIKSDLSTSNNYAYIYKVIDFDDPFPIAGNATYSLTLTASGYTYSQTSFIGWGIRHENPFFDLAYTSSGHFNNPLAFEPWEYLRREVYA